MSSRWVVFFVIGISLSTVSFAAPGVKRQTLTVVPERPAAADFALKDSEGRLHQLSKYRGKVVLLNFWATWCPPCRREMPSMQRLLNKMENRDFVILAVDVGEEEETVFGFIFAMDIPIEYPLLLDTRGEVIAHWPVMGLPTSYLIDRKGRVAYRAVGGREWDAAEIADVILTLIKE